MIFYTSYITYQTRFVYAKVVNIMVQPEKIEQRDELSEQAYRRVRERILKGEYVFGTVISRRDLAAEFDMSLVPINEAISRLEGEYLIENTPRVGTKVRTPTPRDIRGFWAVREGLETQAARLYVRMTTDKERREVIELAKQLDIIHESTTSSEKPDPKALYQWRCAHMQFHTRIAECTKLPFLAQQIEINQLLVFNWFYDHHLYGGRKLPGHWHEQLARSLAEGSEEIADAAMRKHLHNRLEELMLSLERFLLMDESHLLRWSDAMQSSLSKSSTSIK
jgi:DNA-binding GntR family transcriptional regulator